MALTPKKDIGRPSKYKPAYCAEVVDFLAQGYSVSAFAGEIGVAASTVKLWAKDIPEFSDAVKKGQAKAIAFWERATIKLAMSGEGNATACIFGLKNRASDEWADMTKTDHTSSDGSMTPKPGLDASKLSAEVLREIVNAANGG